MIKQEIEKSVAQEIKTVEQPNQELQMNELEGKPLVYLIGSNDEEFSGSKSRITVVPYDSGPALSGISVGYCNLFDENNTGDYGPYLHSSDTAKEYDEGQIDPRGKGWLRNLKEQFSRRKRQGFKYIELDNPDAYNIKDVLGAVDIANIYGLKVLAKNPGLLELEDAITFIKNENIYGIISEDACGTPWVLNNIRQRAGKPTLPIWFVSFGREQHAAVVKTMKLAKDLKNVGVTWSRKGEYKSSEDLLLPMSGT